MSFETMISSDLEASGRISDSTLAYLSQRARNNCYHYVMSLFLKSGLTKADLARRIGKGSDQINHMLASPGNWTIRTLAELLAGISEAEFVPDSLSLKGRAPRNITQEDLLSRYDRPKPLPERKNQPIPVDTNWVVEADKPLPPRELKLTVEAVS